MTYLREDIAAAWAGRNPLEAAFALEGEVFRDVAGRRTLRVCIAGRHYFAKLHYGVGWAEVFKNWLQLKRPVVGAENEYQACRDLAALNIPAPVPAAFARGRGSLARHRSFVLCDELTGRVSLEDVAEIWFQTPPTPALRRRALYAVADFARAFHGGGFIHRDFYICHLLADEQALRAGQVCLAVLDLHRARRFPVVPPRWRKRDLAALLFSALDLKLTRAERLRFVRRYTGRPLREELARRGRFWRAVARRADRLYLEGQRKGVVKGFYQPDGSA